MEKNSCSQPQRFGIKTLLLFVLLQVCLQFELFNMCLSILFTFTSTPENMLVFLEFHLQTFFSKPLLVLFPLQKYMPDLAGLFSHVLVDVSSVAALCSRWFPKGTRLLNLGMEHNKQIRDYVG